MSLNPDCNKHDSNSMAVGDLEIGQEAHTVEWDFQTDGQRLYLSASSCCVPVEYATYFKKGLFKFVEGTAHWRIKRVPEGLLFLGNDGLRKKFSPSKLNPHKDDRIPVVWNK